MWKYGIPKTQKCYGKDIVYSFMKVKVVKKIDYGSHILPVSEEDLKALSGIISSFPQPPNNKISVYKNRRGAYTGIYLWCNSDLGTCRIRPMFATDWSYNLISIDDVRVQVEEEKSAF